MQQSYSLNAIKEGNLQKLWIGLTNDDLKNEQNVFSPLNQAEFVYKGKDSGRRVLFIPLRLTSSTLFLNF